MNHSESIANITAALVAVAMEIENPHKTSNNPHFKSKYADLSEIVNVSRGVLAKHGVVAVQSPGMADGLLTMDTLLSHTSGEWIRGRAATPLQKSDPQGVGSATTYLRRYSLAAMLGLAQEDDDGESAVDRSRGQSRSQKIVTAPNVAARLRELALKTDPDTAAEVEKKIAAGLDIDAARKLSEDLKKLASAEAA